MALLEPRLLGKSFRYALRGIGSAWRNEQNFRLQVLATLAVLILALVLQIEAWELIIVLLVSSLVLILELLNTMIERLADMLEPRIHTYVRVIKDLMAALVLISSVTAAIIGLLIFVPYFFNSSQ